MTVKMTKLALNTDGQHLPGKPRRRWPGWWSRSICCFREDAAPHTELKVGRNGLVSMTFDRAYDATPSSKLSKAYDKALETKEEEDSEVQFVVLAVQDGKDAEVEIGVARCSLESIVKRARDHAGVLEVRNSKGVVVGELTCSVAALAAFGKEAPDEKEKEAAEPANGEASWAWSDDERETFHRQKRRRLSRRR